MILGNRTHRRIPIRLTGYRSVSLARPTRKHEPHLRHVVLRQGYHWIFFFRYWGNTATAIEHAGDFCFKHGRFALSASPCTSRAAPSSSCYPPSLRLAALRRSALPPQHPGHPGSARALRLLTEARFDASVFSGRAIRRGAASSALRLEYQIQQPARR